MSQSKYLAVVTIISLFFVSVPTSARATWFIGNNGILSYISSSILGEEDEVESPEPSESPESEEESEASKKEEEYLREVTKDAAEQVREQAKQSAEIKREAAKQKMEKAAEAKKKILKSKNQQVEYELESEDSASGSSSTLLIRESIKNADGTIAELNTKMIEGEDMVVITRPDGTKVEVSATIANRLQIARNQIKSRTSMPVSLNDQNELILTQQDGTTRVLTILPDEALGRLHEQGVIGSDVDASESELVEEDGLPVYTVSTAEQVKILGLFQVNLNKQFHVSAETGEIVRVVESPLTRFFDFIAF